MIGWLGMTPDTTAEKRSMRKNTFTKRDGSTFKCDSCGRSTRHTGAQSLGSKLCPQCFDLGGIENDISDGHTTLEAARAEIDGLLATIRERGGDAERAAGHLIAVAAPVVVEPIAEPVAVTVDELRDPKRIAAALSVGLTTTEPEQRQIARLLRFDAAVAFAIDWNKIAQTARELGAHFEARSNDDASVTVTMFWAYAEGGAL